MSAGVAEGGGTVVAAGPNVLQGQDFYSRAGILHPIVVGIIAVLFLFAYLRMGSNRTLAPITVFDWIINVALGSTLAGIVNGTSLVRGLLALVTMLAVQYITSLVLSNSSPRIGWLFQGPPIVVAFRGEMLEKVMAKNRIAATDINGALRMQGIVNISQVECMMIEANGIFSLITQQAVRESGVTPDVLMAVPDYRRLCDEKGELGREDSKADGRPGNKESV